MLLKCITITAFTKTILHLNLIAPFYRFTPTSDYILAELVNQPHNVGVEHIIILAANAQCHIGIPFILFSILSSLILCGLPKRVV